MADKSIDQLNAAEKIYASDLFVLQQSGTAKKLTGQVLENWLVSFADGHGGIQSITKLSTSGLVDTYRITLADTTIFDFAVTNGRGITGISKTSTSGLVDTYTIRYNNGTTSTFTVTNGAKGDKGDNTYTWIKYASQEPTEASHSMGDIPDEWRGEYNGPLSSAPTDWKQYKWYKVKGDKGNTGDPATLYRKSVTYQVGDSGTVEPSGEWLPTVPSVPQGKYLWTKTETQFNTGDPIVSYSVARQGRDGSGAVATVCGVGPDSNANITLTAENVGARPDTWMPTAEDVGAVRTEGGTMTGNLTVPAPMEDGHAATKQYVDGRTAHVLYQGAGAHNAIYRGKYLGSSVTDTQWAAIGNGTFDDLYIGDYWTIGDVTYRIAAFDYYLMTGDRNCTAHHVTLVPDSIMYKHVMNANNRTTGGYAGSDMYTTGLDDAKAIINNAFGSDHVLTNRQFLCNAVSNGNPSGGSWYDSTVELMNEQIVYGGKVFGVSNRGSGTPTLYVIDKSQYPLFALRHDLICIGEAYWIRDVVSDNNFACAFSDGAAHQMNASQSYGVRPEFSIKA